MSIVMRRAIKLKKGDIIVVGIAVLLAIILWVAVSAWRDGSGEQGLVARIYMDGQLTYTINLLDNEQELRLDNTSGYNVIAIGLRGIRVLEADCRNQDCVRTGMQNQPGSVIACLPHRLLIRIDGGKEAEFDAVTR